MKKIILALILCCMTMNLRAAEKPTTHTQPQITDAQRAQYWRSEAELLAAKLAEKQAEDKAREIISNLSATCGSQYELGEVMGEPVCKVKPPKTH